MSSAASLVLLPFAIAVAAVGGYLGVLTCAAFLPRARPRREGTSRTRFAVLVPAHDEAALIGRLLASLAEQRYPRSGYDVFVVADNCTDATADIARRAGVLVFERSDATRRAKGYALQWLLERVPRRESYDAYIVFDADSVASPEFLARMDDALASGSRVLQSHYRVLNANASPMSAIREAAFASLHYLRPMGRARLGLSVGLKGNGMCFDARTLERVGWNRAGLAEDVELHIDLVRAHVRTDFVPDATVWADMPTSLRDTASQNLRWEAGRLHAARVDIPRIAAEGIMRRDPRLLDAAIEQLIPPLSVAAMVGGATTAAAVATGATATLWLAALGTGAMLVHVVAGLIALHAPARTYIALMAAPPYMCWKLWLYTRALLTSRRLSWTRTRRPDTA